MNKADIYNTCLSVMEIMDVRGNRQTSVRTGGKGERQ